MISFAGKDPVDALSEFQARADELVRDTEGRGVRLVDEELKDGLLLGTSSGLGLASSFGVAGLGVVWSSSLTSESDGGSWACLNGDSPVVLSLRICSGRFLVFPVELEVRVPYPTVCVPSFAADPAERRRNDSPLPSSTITTGSVVLDLERIPSKFDSDTNDPVLMLSNLPLSDAAYWDDGIGVLF
jgi:hypothetical protein